MPGAEVLRPRKMWWLHRSQTLVGRLTRTLIIFMGGVWVLSALAVAVYVDVTINRNFDDELTEVGQRLFDDAVDDYDRQAAIHGERTSAFSSMRQPILFPQAQADYRLVDASGKVMLASVKATGLHFDVKIEPGFEDTNGWRVLTLKHPSRDIYLQLTDPLEARDEVLRTALLTLILPMLGALPLLALAIRRIAMMELTGLHAMASEISERSGADLRPIQQNDQPRELRVLNEHVNRLLQRLSQSLDVERALAANAAHELRTPLAAARLRLQTALDLAHDHDLRREHVEAALEALQTLSHRAEKLLQLSRAESGASLARSQVDLVQVVGAVAQEFWQAALGQPRLELKVPDAATRPVRGDFDALAIAVRNLVENGLRYGGERVLLEVDTEGSIAVRDWGPGATPAQLRTLRHRHVRHHSDGTGYGLGLSIVLSIVERHGGWLELSSPPAGQVQGFEARIRLRAA